MSPFLPEESPRQAGLGRSIESQAQEEGHIYNSLGMQDLVTEEDFQLPSTDSLMSPLRAVAAALLQDLRGFSQRPYRPSALLVAPARSLYRGERKSQCLPSGTLASSGKGTCEQEHSSGGFGDGSGSKVSALYAQGPDFASIDLHLKTKKAKRVCS